MKQLNITGNRKEYLIKGLSFNYDSSNDILYAYKDDSRPYSNVIIGEFHLEFDKSGSIVGIEILNASGLLGEYDISKKQLENISKIELKVVTRNNSLLIFIIIKALHQEKTAAITMNNLESPIMQAISIV